jgi:hypothetical protein
MTNIIPSVTFGSTTFTGADIVSADLVEEFSPLTLTLPINTLDLTIHSDDEDFSLVNPAGDYLLLQRKTPVTVHETTELGEVLIGQYFLDTWENPDNNTVNLHCVDVLGLLDMYPCLGGLYLTPTYATTLLKSLLDPLGIAYSIDIYFDTFPLTGWIPICTVRQAVQQIAFAAGAYVITSRQNGTLKIGRQLASGTVAQGSGSGISGAGQSRNWQHRWRPAVWSGVVPVIEITSEEEGDDTNLTLLPFVTGMELTQHTYVVNTTPQKLYEGTLPVGLTTIYFQGPMHDLSISGAGTISSSGANYAIVNSTGGSVTLSGQGYDDTTKVLSFYVGGLPDNAVQNVKQITDATLVSSSNAQDILAAVFDYFQQRYKQTTKLREPVAAVGSEVYIDTFYDYAIDGIVEKMAVDLANGFTADVEIVGAVKDGPWVVGSSKVGSFYIS